jgi:hypothetical protein
MGKGHRLGPSSDRLGPRGFAQPTPVLSLITLSSLDASITGAFAPIDDGFKKCSDQKKNNLWKLQLIPKSNSQMRKQCRLK